MSGSGGESIEHQEVKRSKRCWREHGPGEAHQAQEGRALEVSVYTSKGNGKARILSQGVT